MWQVFLRRVNSECKITAMEHSIQIGQIYQHYKTRGEYEILYLATLQAREESGIDMASVVVYRALADGSIWVRPVDYFLETLSHEGQLVRRFTLIR